MKKLLALVALVVLAVVANAGYQKHLKSEEVKMHAAAIRDASSRVLAQIAFFKEDRGATYKEAIAAAEKSTSELDSILARLQTGGDVRDQTARNHVVQYLKASQEATRRSRSLILAKAEAVASYKALAGLVDSYRDVIAAPTDEAARFHANVANYSKGSVSRRSDRAVAELDAAAAALGKPLSELLALRNSRPSGIPADVYVAEQQVTGISFKIVD